MTRWKLMIRISLCLMCAALFPNPISAEKEPQKAKVPETGLLVRGIQAYRSGQYQEAESLLRAFITQQPESRYIPTAYIYLAGSLNAQGKAQQAKQHLRYIINEHFSQLDGIEQSIVMTNYASPVKCWVRKTKQSRPESG